MTQEMKPFTLADFEAARKERDYHIKAEDITVRLIYNDAIRKITTTGEEYYAFHTHIHDQAVRNGRIEKRIRELFPDFLVKTDFVSYDEGPGLQRITITWGK
jgi:hypothetical protein